jgi:hypothetical protein
VEIDPVEEETGYVLPTALDLERGCNSVNNLHMTKSTLKFVAQLGSVSGG